MERFIQSIGEKNKKLKSSFNQSSFKDNLNEEQLNVVNNIKGPMIVIAGAGSGKTRTITYSVAKLIQQGIKPSEIMLVTFTNKAAKEMLKRVENLLGKEPQGIWGGTFHSLANRFIRMYTNLAGLKPKYTIIDQADAYGLMKLSIEKIFPHHKLMNFPTPKICYKILSNSINCNKSIRQVLEWKFPQFSIDISLDLKKIFNFYANCKTKNNVVDFDDLLIIWNKLLDERLIANKIAEKIKYVLVDEYQDTNFIQAEIILKIAKLNQNIMVVGDDAQSIYSFRGANFKNLLNFGDKFKNIQKFKITYNYRSSPEILNLANNSIKNNTNQFYKKMVPTVKNLNKPKFVVVDSFEDQAKYVTGEILNYKKGGIDFSEIAVLYRSNYHSLWLQKELQKIKIPFEVQSGLSFFEQAHVKDVIAHFKIIFNPLNKLAWNRIFTLIPGLGRKTAHNLLDILEDLKNPIKKLTDPEFLKSNKIGTKISSKTRSNTINHFKKIEHFTSESNPSSVIKSLMAVIINHIKNKYENFQDRLKDINALHEFAMDYKTIETFLDNMNLNISEFAENANKLRNNENLNNKILLSTIHKAKGLEWKVVFILSLSETLFPSERYNEDNFDIEEERRIFYVALTRAKNDLYLITPKVSQTSQRIRNLKPSPFLTELNRDLYEFIDCSKTNPQNIGSDYNQLKYEENYIKVKKEKFLPKFTTADKLFDNRE
jgi:DNA helicase-2/ATP-dependent DNA helicase PcrA